MFWFGKKKKLQEEQVKEQEIVSEAPVEAYAVAVEDSEEDVKEQAAPEEEPVPAAEPETEPATELEASEEEPVPAAEPEPAPTTESEASEEAPEAEPTPIPEPEASAETPASTPAPESAPEPETPAEEPAPVPEPTSEPEAPAEEPAPEAEPAPTPAPAPETEPAPEAESEPTPAPAPETEPTPEPEAPAEAPAPAREVAEAVPETAIPAASTPAASAPETYEPTQEEIDARLPAKKPEPRYGHGVGILIFLLMLAIGGAYYYGKVYAEDHYIHGTYVNGIDVSNMTVKEAEAEFEKKVLNYKIDLTFRGGETETIRGSEFSYHSAPDGSLNQIMASQDPYWWFLGFFQKREAEIPEKKRFDADQLRQAVLALPELQETNMQLPTDAYIVYQDDAYTITPHSEGSLLDTQLVADSVVEAVGKEEQTVDVEALGAYAAPVIRMDDEELVAYRDQLNTWISGSITYYLPDGSEMTLNGSTTKEWLSTGEDGKFYKDDDVWEDKIEVFVDNLAMKVNTVGETRSFKTTNAGVISMNGGDYGYSVNKPAEREAIAELLEEGESDDREPMYYTREYGDDHSVNGGIGDTYIEANLSSQHVWIYVDGQMVCESDCVSGDVTKGRGTPTGVFQILYKDTDVDLKGQQLANGQYSYISHVNYWMPFYGGCGFHDADWRTSFGGTIYRYDGSHGCINLPKEIVPKFYSYVSKGMPVVVYY